MASGRDFETKPGQNNSDEISPSTIQAPRFESITHNDDDNDDDEVEPAGTVRRHRPVNIFTRMGNYGTP